MFFNKSLKILRFQTWLLLLLPAFAGARAAAIRPFGQWRYPLAKYVGVYVV